MVITSARFQCFGKYPSRKQLLKMLANNWERNTGNIFKAIASMRSGPGDLPFLSEAIFCAVPSGATGCNSGPGALGLSTDLMVAACSLAVHRSKGVKAVCKRSANSTDLSASDRHQEPSVFRTGASFLTDLLIYRGTFDRMFCGSPGSSCSRNLLKESCRRVVNLSLSSLVARSYPWGCARRTRLFLGAFFGHNGCDFWGPQAQVCFESSWGRRRGTVCKLSSIVHLLVEFFYGHIYVAWCGEVWV